MPRLKISQLVLEVDFFVSKTYGAIYPGNPTEDPKNFLFYN